VDKSLVNSESIVVKLMKNTIKKHLHEA